MTRNDFIKLISEKTAKTQKETKEILDVIESAIVEVIKEEDELRLNIGKFKGVNKCATLARNPKTGEEITVPAKRSPKFSAGKMFKDGVQ